MRGSRHGRFARFYCQSSGRVVPHHVETVAEVAAVHAVALRPHAGVVVAVAIPEIAELASDEIGEALDGAVADAGRTGMTGAEVTPFVLGHIVGRRVAAKLAFAEYRCEVAAEIAIAVAIDAG